MADTEQIFKATIPYFIKPNENDVDNKINAYAYLGDLGFSYSDSFVVNPYGQMFFKEGKIGGVMPEYYNPGDSDTGEKKNKLTANLEDWSEGWKIKKNIISSKWEGENNQIKYSVLFNDYEYQTWNDDTEDYEDTTSQHYLCFGSPNVNTFTRAPFRIEKNGDVSCSNANDDQANNDYSQGYGNNLFQITTWRNNYPETAIEKYRTTVNPNSIKFYNRYATEAGIENAITSARLSFVSGLYGTRGSGNHKNGNFIHFSSPIKTSAILMSGDEIRYITTDISGTSNTAFPSSRYFYLGPSRSDVRAGSSDGTRYKLSGYTVLRGKGINIQAFGTKPTSGDDNRFDGHVSIRAGSLYLQHGCKIRSMKQGRWLPAAGDSNILIRLGTEKKMESDNKTVKVNEINRVIIGAADNSEATEIRSPKGIYLKTNGNIKDTNENTIFFGDLTLKDKKVHMVVRPHYANAGANSVRLGTDKYRWHSVYTTKLFNSSDERLKMNINPIDNKYIQLFDRLQPISYQYNEIHSAYEEDRKQIHFGYSAQNVVQALQEIGLDDTSFAGIDKGTVEQEGDIAYYSLDYSKFVALNAAKIKQLESIVQQQNEQISKQQQQIDLLLSKLA